jgi:hypothetical protein
MTSPGALSISTAAKEEEKRKKLNRLVNANLIGQNSFIKPFHVVSLSSHWNGYRLCHKI